jgi:hypothetical protein
MHQAAGSHAFVRIGSGPRTRIRRGPEVASFTLLRLGTGPGMWTLGGPEAASFRIRLAAEPHHRTVPLAKGGSVTFSPDVNVGVGSLVDRIRSRIRTLLQRARVSATVDRVAVRISQIGARKDEDFGGIGYTLNPKSQGKYISPGSGKAYTERSYRIDFGGVDSTLLRYLAEGLRQAFHQESVYLKDDNAGEGFLWFGYHFPEPDEAETGIGRETEEKIREPEYAS